MIQVNLYELDHYPFYKDSQNRSRCAHLTTNTMRCNTAACLTCQTFGGSRTPARLMPQSPTNEAPIRIVRRTGAGALHVSKLPAFITLGRTLLEQFILDHPILTLPRSTIFRAAVVTKRIPGSVNLCYPKQGRYAPPPSTRLPSPRVRVS